MAELVVINIAKLLLQQLSSPAKDELSLWYSSKTEIVKLENTITTIKDVLHDAEDKGAKSAAVHTWLLRLRDEMYKADDLFDTISTRALQKKVMSGNKLTKEIRLLFSKPGDLVFAVKTAHRVKELRKRLDGIAKDINQFGFIRNTNEDERPFVKRNRQTHSYVRPDDVIGREEDKENILKLLLGDTDTDTEECVSVIAVFGMGGLGKTALAQLIYDAQEVQECFDIRLWACVNDFSNLNEALEQIVASGTEERSVGLQLDQLKDKLWKRIHGKKFFLVLDDVWDDIREQWLRLKVLLDAGERGSKVLLTTRSMTVSKNLATVRPYYALGELSEEHAWLLFKKMAFDSNQEVENQEKEELGRQIVKKCPNVPLAIRTISSFLYRKNKKQWLAFFDNELMKVMSNAENMIMQALRISYNGLPPSLKHCFAYCSLFPKDYVFDKTTVVHHWMAQGLLETSIENQSLEEVGESYLFSLIERCFFQDVIAGAGGNIISCKMHDLFHDLSIEISGTECLKIMKLDDLNGKSPRHLLVGEIKDSPLQGKEIRSLVSLVAGFVERSVLDGVFMNMTSLRTLSLRHLEIAELPSSIGKLVHVRYIDLMKSETLVKLPNAICELQNLLVLRLGGCSNLTMLPDGLHKLVSLRYLETEGCHKLSRIPSGLKEMVSLVMLDRLVVNKDHGGLRFLKCLDNLTGCLDIELPRGSWKDCVADAEESMLRSKTKLSKLALSWHNPRQGEDMLIADAVLDKLQPPTSIDHFCVANFVGLKFPKWLSSLENLVQLVLEGCSRCVELPNLWQLVNLKRLGLVDIPLLEYLEKDSDYNHTSFFPSLEILKIEDMPKLKGWWRAVLELYDADQAWFPSLSELHIRCCPELTQLPLYPFVKRLNVSFVNVNLLRQFVKRAAPKTVELESNIPLASTFSSDQIYCNLQFLRLWNIKDLVYMPDGLVHLSTLRELCIGDCLNLKRQSLLNLLQHLPALEHLMSRGSLETGLIVNEFLENEGMSWLSLTRLKSLWFEFGSDLLGAHLFKGIHHLTNLQDLIIYNDLPHDNYIFWKAPPKVNYLGLFNMEEVAHLNSVIQQLKKLRSLEFCQCNIDEHELDKLPWEELKVLRSLTFSEIEMIKSLPENCRHLPSLDILNISCCPELTYLPEWVRHLRSLVIADCPILKEKCRKPMGSCWPLVQSIPYLQLITSTERGAYTTDSMGIMSYLEFNQHSL